ncbi:MAG: hypothetical protein WC375_12445 [Methanomassiliicoccales archaeon]|jgi:hypothetical protein
MASGIDISSFYNNEDYMKAFGKHIDSSVLTYAYRVMDYGKQPYKEDYIPAQIIFQPDLKTTVVIWKDDSRTVVKCSEEEEFVPEVGFAMALVKKIFPNRTNFLRMVDKACVQQVRGKKEKVAKEAPKADEEFQSVAKAMNDIADSLNKGVVA